MLQRGDETGLMYLGIQYRDDEDFFFTAECCWYHQDLPLGKYINGMRVDIDEQLGIIAKLELLLGGEELTYPEIAGQIEFGDSTFNWTYEWPSEEDLEQFDILTV